MNNNKISLLSEEEMYELKGGGMPYLELLTFGISAIYRQKKKPTTMSEEDLAYWVEGVGGIEFEPSEWGYPDY